MKFPFRDIEHFAQTFWEEKKTYIVDINPNKPKYYVLDMFPYPSGAGLHVGHPLGYIASDIISRYKRQKGFNVLHPMGFDAFGLPAEQYAIQTGRHPRDTTEENIKRYKEQLSKIGFSYDWSREIRTSDPNYYKWTQWIFVQLFQHYFDKKEQKAKPINELIRQFQSQGTINLPLDDTEIKPFTAADWNSYSESKQSEILMNFRLAYIDYSMVNWCQELGTVLANDEVINGKSERGGYPVERRPMRQWFLRITSYAQRLLHQLNDLDWSDSMKEMQRNWIGKSEGALLTFATNKGALEVFTTRPDTIFGVSFMVLAPEHQLVDELTIKEKKAEIDAYINQVKSKSDVERQSEKKVSGVFTGSYAIHPFTQKKIPIYISEYVLVDYGTGAIMAVPSEDDRDKRFAEKFEIDSYPIIDQETQTLIHSSFLNGLSIQEAQRVIFEKIEQQQIGSKQVNYRLRDAGFSRQRYWGEPFPIIYRKGIPEVIHDLPVTLPKVDSYEPTGDGKSPLANAKEWILEEDQLHETDTMPGYAGSSWYFLRYMDPSNQNRFVGEQAEQYWQDVDLYIGGTEHAVGHLLYARFWQNFLFDLQLVSKKEPFRKLVNQGMIQGRSLLLALTDGRKFHVPIHLANREDQLSKEHWQQLKKMDTRFADIPDELIPWKGNSVTLLPEVEKMSKRYHNIVNPDDIIEDYGADVFRMFEMFLGPIEQHKPWDTKGIDGVAKFMRKFYLLFYKENKLNVNQNNPSPEELKVLHTCIKKVTEDIERFSLNTCISAFMIAVNELIELQSNNQDVLKQFITILAPFAPHTAEKIWQDLGEKGSVVDAPFPTVVHEYLVEDEIEYPVSINGKMRVKINLPNQSSKDQAQEIVLSNETVQKWINNKPIKKFIFVPNRIINIVV